jgi:pilus assembly protein CpaB
MEVARIAVLLIAMVAGGLAAMLAGGSNDAPPPAPPPGVQFDPTDILVAKTDIGLGEVIQPGMLDWQPWPTSAANPLFIRKNDRPEAIDKLVGSIVRTPIAAGEPIREARLIRANGSGYMAAILPSGMRAISTPVSPETGAGGFILPNDHVDVILTRRDKAAEKASGIEVHTSETILSNVRVLAIDQTVEDKGGQKVVVGRTATLELSSSQAETLTLSQQLGSLSLALRSLADFGNSKPEAKAESSDRRSSVNMIRFGVSTVTGTK